MITDSINTRRKVVYLCAPVSPTAEELARVDRYLVANHYGPDRRPGLVDNLVQANVQRARLWLRWLVHNTEWSIVASWMPYVEILEEERWRARGLKDDLAVVERCDAVVLVGGRVSSGMAIERDHALRHGLRVIDLTAEGQEPPVDRVRAYEVICRAWEQEVTRGD